MIFHRVIIFLFYWQCISGENLKAISIESVLDQVAIPTKIINEFLQKPLSISSRKYVANEQAESSTIHYENANGFVPLVVSTQPYHFKQNKNYFVQNGNDNGLSKANNNTNTIIKDHSASRKDAPVDLKLHTVNNNRRSFIENNQNDFEILKVNNRTPPVANYDSFYNQSKSNYKSIKSNTDLNYGKSIRNKDRERGKRIQNYMDIYDAASDDSGQNTHSEVSANKKRILQQRGRTRQYDGTTTESYKAPQTFSSTPNYATASSTSPSIKTFTLNIDHNDEYKFKNPITVKSSEYQVESLSSVAPISYPNDKNVKNDGIILENKQSESFSLNEGTNRNYDSGNFRDFSDENGDYIDEGDNPRRVQKTSKRRPHRFESSRKLPKEHREVYDDLYDDQGRKRPNKPKSRQKEKSKPTQTWNEEDVYDDQFDDNENNHNNQQNYNNGNTWNQVAPNIEVSHSNGYEINQIEKPKLHIVPVNIISNFDHATALDNSQGFDITNAMFSGFVRDTQLVSTASPLVSSSHNYLDQNPISVSTSKSSIGTSTAVPDVIVGQNSFSNPIQAVLMPNKLQQSILNQYMQSTVSPTLFAVTPRPSFLSSSTVSPNLQQIFNASPTQQTYANLLQSINSNAKNQNYASSDNNQDQNLYQFQNSQPTSTKSKSERIESQNKKYNTNHGQFLASASLSVGHNSHRQTKPKHGNKRNNYRSNYYKNNSNEDNTSQRNQQVKGQSSNHFVQSTVIPAILHTGIGFITNHNSQLTQNPLFIANSQSNIPIFKGTNEAFDNSMKNLQYDTKNNRYQLASTDNIGGASSKINNINNYIDPLQKAQLPILGAKNVEIINPNLNANAYAINTVPAALITTPIPIFTTTGFLTSKQAYTSSTQEPSGSDRALFNPINFVPNYDLIKSQSVLNSNVVPNNQFVQHNLNLVPVVPGGNFYKQSHGAQVDLANKPKLSSDLEKYAEEMFKESLRTIYNSHKWNNDLRWPANVSLVDNSDLAKLRNELLRLKNNVRNSKSPKDVLEAHQTENKIRTTKPDSSVEHYNKHKSHLKRPHHHSHHRHHSHHHKHKSEINDFLTPPRLNSFISKSPFHDTPLSKKRPAQGHGPRSNFKPENSRLRPRQGTVSQKLKGLESQQSTIVDYRYPIRQHHSKPDYESYNYPTFTTSFPENDHYRSSVEYKSSERDSYDMNHQRTHNLIGLLMKNKQLPQGTQDNYYTSRQLISNIFDEENRRTQSQGYEDVLNSFQKKSDEQGGTVKHTLISRRSPSNKYKI